MVRAAFLATAILLTARSLAAAPPLLVGPLGDVERMEFRGNETFSSSSLRTALSCQLELLPAARNLTTMATLLDVVGELLVRGYRSEGFADVAVAPRFDEQTGGIVITIVEGTRYREGEFRLSGVDGLPRQILHSAVVEGVPPDDATLTATSMKNGRLVGDWRDPQHKPAKRRPLWGRRKHASFGEMRVRHLENKLIEALQRQGYLDSSLSVQFVPAEEGIVELHVDVERVGRTVRITDVEIIGAATNPRDAILELADIHPGDRWTLSRRLLAEHRLRDCGRFLHAQVTMVPGSADPLTGTVEIRLRECESIPPLGSSLSSTDRVLMKCAQWLEGLPHNDQDIVVEVDSQTASGPLQVRLVLSDGHGLLLDVTMTGPSGQSVRYAAVGEREHWSLMSERTQRRFDIVASLGTAPRITLDFHGLPEATSGGRKCGLAFSLSMTNRDEEYSPIRCTVQPVAFLADSRRDGVVHERVDGHGIFRGSRMEVRIDEATGRLISLQSDQEDLHVRIATEDAAFEHLKSELDNNLQALPNVADPDRPVASLTGFLVGEFATLTSDVGREELSAAITAWQQLLSGPPGARLEAVVEQMKSSEEVFVIPPPADNANLQVLSFGAMFLQANRLLFPRDATPAVLSRELTAAMLLKDKSALKSAIRIGQATTTGPLTCWYAAEILRYVNPQLGQAFAEAGLKRMEPRHLRHDLASLLQGDSLVGDNLRDAVRELRNVPVDQLDVLFGMIDDKAQRNALIAAVSQSDGTIDESVLRVGEVLWRVWARKTVARRLQTLAQPAVPTEVTLRTDHPTR